MKETRQSLAQNPILAQMAAGQETLWINPCLKPYQEVRDRLEISPAQIQEAEDRLQRFAPFLMECFPETAPLGGLIESPLVPIPRMQALLAKTYHVDIPGRLLLKQDSHLAIAGSVKARGGIYEVLKHTEDLAIRHGLLTEKDNYAKLAQPAFRDFFRQYTVQVGSTGNLGLSIGIMSAAVGFRVVVHMSTDAKQWKKDLLRSKGVEVIEYAGDYGKAVEAGRKDSKQDPNSYFVDDEASVDLFLGYAAAAGRLKAQLEAQGLSVDRQHPLLVYLPCGVGGAPGGICYGLKAIFGDNVHCFLVEPVNAPCMTLGLATGLHNQISVQDIGLSGVTHADGLAVGRPSGFVGRVIHPLVSGAFTIADFKLYDHLRELDRSEGIRVEPSACAAFAGPERLGKEPAGRAYVMEQIGDAVSHGIQIAWVTGGRLVPETTMEEYLHTHL